jgi:hypothetical protein
MADVIMEPARETSVFRRCDVLIVGGGPAGSAAAASAARAGADTVLVERYGHLGGLSTGGLVVWIDRMTDWTGRQVITGFANELLDRIPRDAIIGPSDDLWGSRDPALVDYWGQRSSASNGIVSWAPTTDPEMLKIAYNEIVLESGAKLLLHSWAVAVIQEGDEVQGVIFESKSGRQAILADVVIDTSGDGDIFAAAGAEFESDVSPGDIHHTMNLPFRVGGVDMSRYYDFRNSKKDEYDAVMKRGREVGVDGKPGVMPRNDQCRFGRPKMAGYSSLDVEDLTTIEVEGRRGMLKVLDFYRENMPGFEDACILDTASQLGVRHSRRLVGTDRVVREQWTSGARHDDEVMVSPPPNPRHPNVSIPLGALIPAKLENLLAAGRNLSSDAVSHTFMREIPQCWAMGQAAGTAAALAADAGVRVRDVNTGDLRKSLEKQGVFLHPLGDATPTAQDPDPEKFEVYLPLDA